MRLCAIARRRAGSAFSAAYRLFAWLGILIVRASPSISYLDNREVGCCDMEPQRGGVLADGKDSYFLTISGKCEGKVAISESHVATLKRFTPFCAEATERSPDERRKPAFSKRTKLFLSTGAILRPRKLSLTMRSSPRCGAAVIVKRLSTLANACDCSHSCLADESGFD